MKFLKSTVNAGESIVNDNLIHGTSRHIPKFRANKPTPLSNVEVKNAWSYTLTTHYTITACAGTALPVTIRK